MTTAPPQTTANGALTAPLLPVSRAVLLAMIERAKRRSASGVLGVLGQPGSIEVGEVEHDGQRVVITTACSALAAREAVLGHEPGSWTVLVTDRDEDDLGPGVLAHVAGQRLHRPDPWEAVRRAFAASGISSSLTKLPGGRDVAGGLLAAQPPGGWPPAPAGVLTRAHAFASIASEHLDLAGEGIDALSVLAWSTRPGAADRLSDLQDGLGGPLTEAVLDWVAESCGPLQVPVRSALIKGTPADLVPLGIVVGLLTDTSLQPHEAHAATKALVRLENVLGKASSREALEVLAQAAVAVLSDLLRSERRAARAERVLTRTGELLIEIDAGALAIHSDLLANGLRARLQALASALDRWARAQGTSGSGTSGSGEASAALERAWDSVAAHRLASGPTIDAAIPAARAAVRLHRWLGTDQVDDSAGIVGQVRVHLDTGAWADAAINDVFTGVDDPTLSVALGAVFDLASARRERENRLFAARLAADVGAGRDPSQASETTGADRLAPVWNIESVLGALVVPLARTVPVLLLVMDGMSAAAATEILADVSDRLGWIETGAQPGATRRAGALAVLPSLTNPSRTSLLSGCLATGDQAAERTGHAEFAAGVGKVTAALFHKKGVDTTRPGALLADGLGEALDDPKQARLVTVVLNSIDDALDRSDPVGKLWDTDEVKHLSGLLGRARAAGRVVVMTADHGHVVERRRGIQRSVAGMSSARSRAATPASPNPASPNPASPNSGFPGLPVDDGEVFVEGERVLTPDHRAVLAVDEGLRYGPLKAGYHGGASAQEVVVPVAVLLPEEGLAREVADGGLGLPLLGPQEPAWWSAALGAGAAVGLGADLGSGIGAGVGADLAGGPGNQRARTGRKSPLPDPGPTLFDQQASVPTPDAVGRDAASLGRRVVASETFEAQWRLAPRVVITPDQISALIDALATARGHRLSRIAAAALLGHPTSRIAGPVGQARQLLNVEGYNVLGQAPDGQAIILDVTLLREQFGLP